MKLTPTTIALGVGLSIGASACDVPRSSGTEEVSVVAQALEEGQGGVHSYGLNEAGLVASASPSGAVDTLNPFFQALGTNGRSCVTCHQAHEGFSVTPLGLRLRFEATQGLDPIFRPHDGANAPSLDVSTVEARRTAYSVMLDRATIRVGLPVKPTSEFELTAVDDPYGHASAAQLSLFRRPLPTTNLRFATALNWDGRNTPAADLTNIRLGLKNQANGATVGHAQAAAPISDAVREAIVDFETSLTSAQTWTFRAGDLAAGGASGGPLALLAQLHPLPAGPFALFGAWAGLDALESAETDSSSSSSGRLAVARGERIFNGRTFTIDLPGVPAFAGTCASCHDQPNVGGHSVFRMIDIGVSAPERRSAQVPLYTFRHKGTGATLQTTDPGRALITGLWADMNKFKVPAIRALAARAPYFHDGSARSVSSVIEFYVQRFKIALSDGERRDLLRFLESL